LSSGPVLPGVRWRCNSFGDLTVPALYAMLRLRAEVFVVEQACAFQDLDGLDQQAVHVRGETGDDEAPPILLAYSRLLPASTAFAEASIGRVVTAGSTRGTGLGHQLMQASIQTLHRLWGKQPIRIGAQAHLEAFYRQHGFEPDSDLYLEDGIKHIEMLRRA
jgi:ElaA protein